MGADDIRKACSPVLVGANCEGGDWGIQRRPQPAPGAHARRQAPEKPPHQDASQLSGQTENGDGDVWRWPSGAELSDQLVVKGLTCGQSMVSAV